MPQLVDVDGKTVPVRSRKLREPAPGLHKWDEYQRMGIKEGETVWVTMTTKGQLADVGIERFDMRQTTDGWEYLVMKAELIGYLKTINPPFKVM